MKILAKITDRSDAEKLQADLVRLEDYYYFQFQIFVREQRVGLERLKMKCPHI